MRCGHAAYIVLSPRLTGVPKAGLSKCSEEETDSDEEVNSPLPAARKVPAKKAAAPSASAGKWLKMLRLPAGWDMWAPACPRSLCSGRAPACRGWRWQWHSPELPTYTCCFSAGHASEAAQQSPGSWRRSTLR